MYTRTGMKMRRLNYNQHPRTFLPFKTSPYIFIPAYSAGVAVAVAARAQWAVSLPLCDLPITVCRRCRFSRLALSPRDPSTNTIRA